MNKIVTLIFAGICLASCSDNAIDKKGIQVNEIVEDENGKKIIGLNIDSLKLETRPNGVLLTNNPAHRITPIFKVNYTKKDNKPFIGSNKFHTDWEYEYESGNNWHQNIVPGFEALYGYNLVNISHYNNQTKTENKLFDKPVLIKTVYYPTFSKDSLNFEPVNRKYFLVSVYDEDSNKDGFINANDLRRFYYFDIEGKNKSSLIPENYAVVGSDYDSGNDFMYVFAKADKNKNGKIDANEPTNIFWIDLKNPENNGIQY
uniref:EF-hand domain-containing protein n=1 Tax=Flavobacterium sp. TaxID=239 RepID=UPI004048F4B9